MAVLEANSQLMPLADRKAELNEGVVPAEFLTIPSSVSHEWNSTGPIRKRYRETS